MTRAIVRHVVHRITEHPDTEVTYEADCLHCGWSATPSTDGPAVNLACMEHSGKSNHRGFRRTMTGFIFVVRDGEGDRPTCPQSAPPAP